MIEFDFQEYCSGCGACCNICPVSAISMQQDDEGFLFPFVDREKCISCGKCERVCPHINAAKLKSLGETEGKAVWLYASQDAEAKMASSSGAACYELGKAMLKQGGKVCGCVWDKNLRAIHMLGQEETLKKTQGSKYVQSDTGNVYRETEEYLKSGGTVLFTGTPCQAAAMHRFVMGSDGGKYREQLITVAVICHGVASPLAWESYKNWECEQQNSPLVTVNFRDKSKKGYQKSYCRFTYKNGTVSCRPTFLPTSKYMEATLVYNLAMRRSCSHCDCKGIQEGIDLIAGDWYAEYRGEGRLGTSCILAFTERGKAYAQASLSGLKEFSYQKVLERNGYIEKSVNLPENREKFLKGIREDLHFWNRVEELYPSKYRYKKLLVRLGLFDFLKKITG